MNERSICIRFFARRLICSVCFLAVTVCLPGRFLAADDRPNIVMAFADDWGKYASAYAKLEVGSIHDHVSTPNFDSVAHDGVLFTRAFVQRTLLHALPKFIALRPTFLALWSGFDPPGRHLGYVHTELSDPAGIARLPNRTHLQSLEPRHAGKCSAWRCRASLQRTW